jgi:nicotinamidase-related amidase/isocitrate/isopropylmalate dehydrogenase
MRTVGETPVGQRPVAIGLAVGGGAGPELAHAFGRAVARLSAVHNGAVEIATCPQRLSTYSAIDDAQLSAAGAAHLAESEAAAYADWLRGLARSGTRAVFRTACNAQALYLVREALWAVKPEGFTHPAGDLLVVRDELQGFYSGRNSDPATDDDRIERSCEFTRERTNRVLDFARTEAAARWDAPADHLVAVYKFHLLDKRFAQWVADYGRAHGVAVELYQPDTVNRRLRRGLLDGRVALVGANEWANVMHTELVARFAAGHQEQRHSRNVYLADEVAGLEEYQTVHGSADDIAGEGLVNPSATLRAAAALLERHAGFDGAEERMEHALRSVHAAGVSTPDFGGRSTTEDVTEAALDAYADGRGLVSASGDGRRGALVVVDLQNDFCAPEGHFARRGLVDPAATAALADRVQETIVRARAAGIEVIFVRMEADAARDPATVIERNRREGHSGFLAPRGFGSDFFRVAPLPSERVITKSGYDPFLAPELEAHLRDVGIEQLTLAGAFADVCVDATARSGYQKGYRIQVLEDCTLGLERSTADALAFMTRFYGAEVLPSEAWLEDPDAATAAHAVGGRPVGARR